MNCNTLSSFLSLLVITVLTKSSALTAFSFFGKYKGSTTTTTTSCLFSAQTEQTMSTPRWFQKEISITAPYRGCHLITEDINKAIQSELSTVKIGMANLFIQHTSASLTINENADKTVRLDLEKALNRIVPESWNHDGTFKHVSSLKRILLLKTYNFILSSRKLSRRRRPEGYYFSEIREFCTIFFSHLFY